MKLRTGFSIWTTFCLVVLFGCVIGIMITGWQNSVTNTWNIASIQTQNNIMQAMNASIDHVKFASRSIPFIEPLISEQNIPDADYDPNRIVRSLDAFNTASGYQLGSFGMLMGKDGAPDAKLSWQIAIGFGCDSDPHEGEIYAFSDLSIHPRFIGYCVFKNETIDTSFLAYDAFDWGLKPEEKAILNGDIEETFILVSLLGQFTLTYEIGYPNYVAGPKYAVTFAELNLQTFSDYLAQDITIMDGKGYAYVFETTTGAMIASTIPDTVVMPNGTRFLTHSSPNEVIANTHEFDSISSDWLVTHANRVEPGIDWTVVVAVRSSDVYGDMYYSILVASMVSLTILIVLIIATFVGAHLWITRPVQNLMRKVRGEKVERVHYTPFDDFAGDEKTDETIVM